MGVPKLLVQKAPLHVSGTGTLRLHVLLDYSVLEVIGDNGTHSAAITSRSRSRWIVGNGDRTAKSAASSSISDEYAERTARGIWLSNAYPTDDAPEAKSAVFRVCCRFNHARRRRTTPRHAPHISPRVESVARGPPQRVPAAGESSQCCFPLGSSLCLSRRVL